MKTDKTLLGLLAGVAVGTVIGILLAPDKGSETRKKVVEKGEDYAEKLKQKFNDFVDSVNTKDANSQNDEEASETKTT